MSRKIIKVSKIDINAYNALVDRGYGFVLTSPTPKPKRVKEIRIRLKDNRSTSKPTLATEAVAKRIADENWR